MYSLELPRRGDSNEYPQSVLSRYEKEKYQDFLNENSDIFHILDQNIDCGYSLEPPRRGGSNEYSQSVVLAK